MKGQLKSKDELVKDVLETAAQAAYSPFEQLGIMNPDTPPGPDVIYNHDPSMDGKSFIRRVQPPSSPVQLPMVLGFLEDQTARNSRTLQPDRVKCRSARGPAPSSRRRRAT